MSSARAARAFARHHHQSGLTRHSSTRSLAQGCSWLRVSGLQMREWSTFTTGAVAAPPPAVKGVRSHGGLGSPSGRCSRPTVGDARQLDIRSLLVPSGRGVGGTRWFAVSGWRLREQSDEKGPPPPPTPPSRLRKVLPSLTARENIYTLPNLLTATRIVAAPFVGYCILHDHHALALGLFAYAGVTDLLDGWIARRWNLQTVVGTIIDPMADKMLMTVLTVCLAAKGLLPVWLAVIILGRDVALAASAIYYRWISLPPPKTFTRYWDFSLPSAEVRPTTISKYNTALQLGLMGLTTVAPVIPAVDLATPLGVMQYVVAATTIWSGASYVYSKDAVKILSQNKQQEPDEPKKKE